LLAFVAHNLREANQAGLLRPTALVTYDAEIADVSDTRDEAALLSEGMDSGPAPTDSFDRQRRRRASG